MWKTSFGSASCMNCPICVSSYCVRTNTRLCRSSGHRNAVSEEEAADNSLRQTVALGTRALAV